MLCFLRESPPAGTDDTAVHVQKLKDQAKSIRIDAGLAFKAKQDECGKKLFNIDDDCLNEARQAKKKALAQARLLEDQAADPGTTASVRIRIAPPFRLAYDMRLPAQS